MLIRAFNISGTRPDDSLSQVLDEISRDRLIDELRAIGHRVVHGGELFDGPVVVTDETLAELRALSPLAPLHQPANLDLISACSDRFPEVIQVACFDT
ncbi:MAG: acetate kinase, partial [Woeseiaceae bacterium]|nr:acetate kinase [Woeseiaceae bacterium]